MEKGKLKNVLMMMILGIIVMLSFTTTCKASDVIDLETEDVDPLLTKGQWLVEFYAPWCGFCKQLAPIYEELATKVKKENKPYKIAKMDCTKFKQTCERFGATAYPTVVFIKDGKVHEFNRGRQVDEFMMFCERYHTFDSTDKFSYPPKNAGSRWQPKKKAEPEANEEEGEEETPNQEEEEAKYSDAIVLTDSNVKEKVNSGGSWFIKFFAPWCGWCKQMKPEWNKFAEKYKNDDSLNVAVVDCTVQTKTRDLFKVNGFPTLYLIKEGKVYEFEGLNRNVASFEKFAKSGYKEVKSIPSPFSRDEL